MFTNVKDNNGEAPPAIVYMPKGTHTICCTVNGQPQSTTVHVTAAAADVLQRDLERKLEAHNAGTAPRPCGYFDHTTGEAAFLPQRFVWDDAKGVLLQVEWTSAGSAAVKGKNYSYFSPRCALDEQGNVAGLVPEGVEVGSLVNDPAFGTIGAIAAARVTIEPEPGGKSDNLATDSTLEKTPAPSDTGAMDEIKKKLGLAPEATEADVYAAIDKLKGDKDAATQAATASNEAKQAAEAACEEKKQEVEALRAQLNAANQTAADSFISAACAAGKIAPKDEETQKQWRTLYAANPQAAQAAMNAVQITAAAAPGVGGQTPPAPEKSIAEMYDEQTANL